MDAGRYKSYTGTRGPSALVWKGFDFAAIAADPSIGFHKFDDFEHIASLAAPGADATGEYGGYTIQLDGSTTGNGAIVQTAFVAGSSHRLNAHGVLSIDSAGTAVDNEAFVITDAGAAIILDSSTLLAAFEARVKFSNVADTIVESFVGLLEAGLALSTTVPITATADTIVDDKAWIGFDKLESNGDSMDFKFQENGTTSPVTGLASAAALVADTWIKLGFRLDRNESGTKRVTIFVDGAPKTTYITDAVQIGATFPNSTALVPCFATKARSTTDYGVCSIDWWRVAQMF